ncbi:DICT sensory domain-containing protein [Halegenticoccus soli]|uniref:DICT sensory domain-containing protein n=1 Tax=Halegenticoccus soli TaxID=1985678 RepID=UPI000C6E12BB|nr:DICT sensory domain-containing protein [Halegenticoccus soli]
MDLHAIIDAIERRERTLTLFNPPRPSAVAELAEQFDAQQVVVEGGTAVGGPDSFAVLSEGDRALAAIDAPALLGRGPSDAFRELLGYLDRTTFSSYDTRQMTATSREIEDRAWRAGVGSLHAGFQTVSALRSQRALYERLARTDLDVHAYAVPDAEAPDIAGVTLHLDGSPEIERTWFVVFDGGAVPSDKCALLAEERDDGRFRGVWTYDPDLVDAVLDHLTERYAVRT